MAKRWVQLFAAQGGGLQRGVGDFVVWGPSTGIYLPHYDGANLQNLEIPISDLDKFCLT